MGGAIHDKKEQMKYLQNRLDMVLTVLDSMDPEQAGVEEIDSLLKMLDDIELKCKQFRIDWSEQGAN
ncbi:SE1561 family protein [Bacillus suaedae]|uniref:Uncharacterized protein n=1 Tax=Halalkalibacter suaedae TaxID=2822140 RepID=A0A940X086_9BACI|nr:SE1561 family protein [Bacillus suaedae]MBP3952386.1 hypothetical protein [Bacillus suaedae]